MDEQRLDEILSALPARKVAVVGDFCVDRYLHIDPGIADRSRETNLPIHQVADVRSEPGGGANVVHNLAALGVGQVFPVGFIGLDGEGFELNRVFDRLGIQREFLRVSESRHTPVYVKPIVIRPDGPPEELSRFDIFPRQALLPGQESALIESVRAALERADALIVADYGEAGKEGVVTTRVREAAAELGRLHRDKPILADSRLHIDKFRDVIIKPNRQEAAGFIGGMADPDPPMTLLLRLGQDAVERNRRPVFITLGPEGILICSASRAQKIPVYPSERDGPIDTVGAGDTTLAALAAALAAGATTGEAAVFAMLAASITIQEIGRCGTASPEAIRKRFGQYAALHPDVLAQQ